MQTTTKQIASDRHSVRGLTHSSNIGRQMTHGRAMLHGNMERAHPPANFHFPYMVGRPTPYQVCDGDGREHFCGGVLQTDQVVWLQQPLQQARASRRVMAFTPTAGLVRLESRRLTEIRRSV